MNILKPLAETNDSVTLRRADFDALVAAAEDAIDHAAVEARRAHEARVGKAKARRNYLTVIETRRLLDGESPLRVWRDKRGLSQRALAEAAGVGHSYLSEIESGRKPGSTDALHRLAGALDVSMDDLIW